MNRRAFFLFVLAAEIATCSAALANAKRALRAEDRRMSDAASATDPNGSLPRTGGLRFERTGAWESRDPLNESANGQ